MNIPNRKYEPRGRGGNVSRRARDIVHGSRPGPSSQHQRPPSGRDGVSGRFEALASAAEQ